MDFKGIALGIDSATDHCSVALSVDGDCFSRSVDTPRDHSRALLPMVSDLLDEHQVALKEVDLLAYSQGPGSFTGLRIGIGVIQGLAYGASKPTLGMSTLLCQVESARITGTVEAGDTVYSLLDARMDEIYWARVEVAEAGLKLSGSEHVCAPGEWQTDLAATGRLVGIGSGWRYQSDMPAAMSTAMHRVDQSVTPCAEALLRLLPSAPDAGEMREAAAAKPVYVRESIAWKKRDQQPPIGG